MSNVKNPPDIGCLEAIESLYAWLDGELENSEMTNSLEHHLSHCKSCWSRAEMEKSLTEHIQRSAESEPGNPRKTGSPESLKNRLDELLKKL
jgi:anti-sigma factor (TIGR02949 family)